MIGILIRDLAMLKVLDPIIEYFIKHNIPYNAYYYDVHRGIKEYNRASSKNINASNPRILKKAKVYRAVSSNNDLLGKLKKDGIKKFVSVEIALCHPELKWGNIKTYSIQYLSDSIWRGKSKDYTDITRTYFSSQYLLQTALSFSGTKYNPNKHLYLGSPLFDQLRDINGGDNILVLLPNLRAEHVPSAFGSADRFFKIMGNIAKHGNLIYKTRKKQWLPAEIKPYASEIIYDGSKLYPGSIVSAFNKCDKVVIFNSSGLYECVVAGKMVYNIPIPHKRWVWDGKKMGEYFSYKPNTLYNWSGVVKNIEQNDAFSGNFSLDIVLNDYRRKEWLERFVGQKTFNSAEKIARDILSD